MDAEARKRAIAAAQHFEQTGQLDAAAAQYVQAGELEHAARVLVQGRRYQEAGSLLLESISIRPIDGHIEATELARLSTDQKKTALRAAACLSRANVNETAVEIYVALGEIPRAVETLIRMGEHSRAARLQSDHEKKKGFLGPITSEPVQAAAGVLTLEVAQRLEKEGKHDLALDAYIRLKHFASAGRMARMLNRAAEAGTLFEAGGMPYEAALCFLEVGDTGKALDNFTHVARDDARYRESAIQAIQLASSLNFLSIEIDNFLAQFLKSGAGNVRELDALFSLASLYKRRDYLEQAVDALRKVLERNPNYPGAKAMLDEIANEQRGSVHSYERILREEETFRRADRSVQASSNAPPPGVDAFMDLPPMPDLGAAPAPVARPTGPNAPAPAWRDPHGRTPNPRTSPPGPWGQPPTPGYPQPGYRPGSYPPAPWGTPGYPPQPGYPPPQGYAPPGYPPGYPPQNSGSYPPAPVPTPYPGYPAAGPQQGAGATQQVADVPRPDAATAHYQGSSDSGLHRLGGEAPAPEGRSDLRRASSGAPQAFQAVAQADPAARAAADSARTAAPPATGPQHAPTTAASPAAPAKDPRWLGFVEGSVLAGRYRFSRKLGEGGMAVVFKAHDSELDEDIAIKVFTQTVEDEQMIARFKQELSLSRKLNHPNIIRLYDIGTFEGHKYITMELLHGKDMNNFMGKPIDFRTGIDWLIQSCHGLDSAHRKGIIHRDIKPHNIFICSDGAVKVMDFGIAKNENTAGMTTGNMIAGTPDYMSPEQISGFSRVTASTDIYALGITAYQMFAGRVPFTHEELLPLLMMHMNEAPLPPSTHNPAIPPELDRIILKLLEKDPANRYPTCGDLARALEDLRRQLG